ncbi:MAG: AAA family ATPase [Planctomycetota bacterium]|nr:AAA family ATPase [Planctomycetota bacterium]
MLGGDPNSPSGLDDPGDPGEAILRFASTRPAWMQDAFRRLTVQRRLEGQDRVEVLNALKTHHGLPPSAPVPPPIPMSREHVRTFTARDVRLLAIMEPTDVSRLASGQVLTFGEHGITVVYGGNGTGKSSYFRIPKSVGRGRATRPRRGQDRPQILGDVYRASPTPLAPRAQLKLLDSGRPLEVDWRLGGPIEEALRDIHVFDQHAVPVYVDEDCLHEFVPFGLQVFDDLAELCRELDAELRGEAEALRATSNRLRPALPPTSQAGQFLSSLTHRTTAAQIADAVAWAEEDEASLTRLEAALGGGRQLVQLADAHRRIEAIRNRCASLEATTNDAATEDLRSRIADLQQAEAMAASLARGKLADAPVDGVGSQPWRALFNAARRFSEEVAYPDVSFPNTGPDSRCVLCQETLTAAARERMQRFEELAGEETQRGVIETRQRLDKALAELAPAEVLSASRQDLEAALASLGAWVPPGDTELPERVERFQHAAAARATVMREAGRTASSFAIERAPLPPSPVPELNELLGVIEAAQARAEGAVENRTASEAERNELQARKVLASAVDQIGTIVQNLQILDKLEACRRDLRTGAITAEGTRLKQRHLNAAFQEALTAELRALHLTDIHVCIDARGERGVLVTKLRLANATTRAIAPGDVLSRGEQQLLAIACFLAELQATGATGAVVFDDPISSLDRERREEVARRLTKLAATRQVIVFTHDISFTHLLEDFSEREGATCAARTLEKRGSLGAGFVVDGLPFALKRIDSRINELESQDLPRLRKSQVVGGDQYEREVSATWTRLRRTWEGAIELKLFNGVVKRYQHDVKTKLLDKVPIPTSLKVLIREAMGRLSAREVHDEAVELTRSQPTPEDLEAEVEALRKFIRCLEEALKHEEAGRTTTPRLTPPSPPPLANPEQPSRSTAASPVKQARSDTAPFAKLDAANLPPPAQLSGLARDERGQQVFRTWEGAALTQLTEAVVNIRDARHDLEPLTLERFLQGRKRSGLLPVACLVETGTSRTAFVYSKDDLETALERWPYHANGSEPRVVAPRDPAALQRALTVLRDTGLRIEDLARDRDPADESELFVGVSARWILTLNGRPVPVLGIEDLPALLGHLGADEVGDRPRCHDDKNASGSGERSGVVAHAAPLRGARAQGVFSRASSLDVTQHDDRRQP